MQRPPSYRHADQLSLFHPRPMVPQWHMLPVKVQQRVTRLLAQLLREHVAQRVVHDNNKKGMSDE